MDLLYHLRVEHDLDNKTKKWVLTEAIKPKDKSVRYKSAYKYEIGPHPDRLVFVTDIVRYEGFFCIAVRVIGGKQVAKKYRAELRVSSNKRSVSITNSGPVYPIDCTYLDATADKDCFEISRSKFASFNHGKEYFGEHNKDENGNIALPLSVKIVKKKLGLPADK